MVYVVIFQIKKLYIIRKTEIDLTTTYSSAKGTYTNESYRLFSDKEKFFLFNTKE